MLKFLKKLDSGLKKIEFVLICAAGALVFFMMFYVAADVIMRNVFNSPITGVFEVVQMLVLAVVVLGFAYVQGQKANIVVEIATEKWPQRAKNWLYLLGYIVGFIGVFFIAWRTSLSAITAFVEHHMTSGRMPLPTWPIRTVYAIAMIALAVRLLLDILIGIFTLNQTKPDQTDDKGAHNIGI